MLRWRSPLSRCPGGALHHAAWLFLEPLHCAAPEEPFHCATQLFLEPFQCAMLEEPFIIPAPGEPLIVQCWRSSVPCRPGGTLHCATLLLQPFTAPPQRSPSSLCVALLVAPHHPCPGGVLHDRATPEEEPFHRTVPGEPCTMPPWRSSASRCAAALAVLPHAALEEPFIVPRWRIPSSSLPWKSPSLRRHRGALHHAILEEPFIATRNSS